ncbi:hypothetical protein ACHAWF_006672 [Thalassiosira exigua]
MPRRGRLLRNEGATSPGLVVGFGARDVGGPGPACGDGGGGDKLRGMRRPRPNWPHSRQQRRRQRRDNDDECENDAVDEMDAIEMAPSEEMFRKNVLASVGLDDDEEDDDEDEDYINGNGNMNPGRGRGPPRDRQGKGRRRNEFDAEMVGTGENDSQFSEGEGDEIEEDDFEYESFNRSDEDHWRDAAKRIACKLIWMIIAAVSIAYVLYDDEMLQESEADEDVEPKEMYSYKGYKDARIPDDDIAQYGGGLFGAEVFGIDSNETEDDAKEQPQEEPKYHEPTGIVQVDALWRELDGYTEMAEPYDAQQELPVFWHVPKCGGTTLQDLMMHCIGMVGANEVGATYANKEELKVVQLDNGNRYVNVDMSNPEGITHAKYMGLGQSGLANVVMTSWLDQTAAVFDTDHKGRCFTLLRHPIRRAISMFYYLKDATWEHTYSEVYKDMSIEEYASSQYAEDNWMVRFLTNEMSGAVYERHLALAKEVLESKCLVGLLEEFKLSFKRFNDYFGWNGHDFGGPVKMNNRGTCVTRVMGNPDNTHSHPTFDEGSEVWNLLLNKNRYDLSLYEHAVHLFHNVQGNLVK